jgi:hypothetical protein
LTATALARVGLTGVPENSLGFAAQAAQQVFQFFNVRGNVRVEFGEPFFGDEFEISGRGADGLQKLDRITAGHHFTPVDSGETFVLQRCFGKGKLDVTCSSPFERAQKTLAADLSISVQIDFQVQLSIRQDIELTNHTPPDLS